MDINFFSTLNCPLLHSGQFRNQKVSISMKNPSNYPIKSFARLKKITTLIFKKSGALIVKRDTITRRAWHQFQGLHNNWIRLDWPITFVPVEPPNGSTTCLYMQWIYAESRHRQSVDRQNTTENDWWQGDSPYTSCTVMMWNQMTVQLWNVRVTYFKISTTVHT